MRNKLVSVVGVNPPADIASGRIAEVRSRSMSCNCMTRTSQQEEIQKRKSDIRFLGRANDRDYMDIGKIIFEKYRNGEVVDTDMAALCEAIDQRNEEVTKIQAEIDRINGVVTADATEEEEVFEETSEE